MTKMATARPPSSYPVTGPGYEEVIDSLAKQRKAQSIAMNMALCTVTGLLEIRRDHVFFRCAN